MRLHSLFSALAAAALMASAVQGADVPTAVDANDAAVVKGLVGDLGSPDFATRERAQKALETVPAGQVALLQKYADAAGDAEAKARLEVIMGTVEENGAMMMPPISLEVKDASMPEVAAALSKAMKIKIDFNPAVRAESNDLFTLKVTDEPYWEVLRKLGAQHDLWMDADGPGSIAQRPVERVQVTKGLAVFVGNPPQQGKTGPSLIVSAALDPRMKVLEMHPMEFDDARDDRGQTLQAVTTVQEEANRKRLVVSRPAQSLSQSQAVSFAKGDGPSKSITVRGRVKFLLQISEKRVEVAEAGKHVGEAIALGDSKVTLRSITPAAEAGGRAGLELAIVPNDATGDAPPSPAVKFTAAGMSLNGGLSAGSGGRIVIDSEGSSGGMMIGAGGSSSETTHVTVTDANGKAVANYSVPRGLPVTSIHAVAGDFKEPLKFVFSVPEKTREVTVPFEFKNLAIK